MKRSFALHISPNATFANVQGASLVNRYRHMCQTPRVTIGCRICQLFVDMFRFA